MEQQLIIVAIKGQTHKPIFGPALPKIAGAKKSELTKSGNWKGWILQLRNPEAYKAHPILTKK